MISPCPTHMLLKNYKEAVLSQWKLKIVNTFHTSQCSLSLFPEEGTKYDNIHVSKNYINAAFVSESFSLQCNIILLLQTMYNVRHLSIWV